MCELPQLPQEPWLTMYSGRADLSFKLLPELLCFVLFEVVHYHHRGVDLPNCHVCICEGRHASLAVNALPQQLLQAFPL